MKHLHEIFSKVQLSETVKTITDNGIEKFIANAIGKAIMEFSKK